MRLATYFLFFGLALADETKLTYTSCDSCIDRANTSMLRNITLRLYTGNTTDDYTSILIGEATDLLDSIDSSKPTVLYIHAWTENPDNTSSVAVIGAYAERGDHNVLAVDYGDIAAMSWAFAFRSFEGILYQLIRTLNQLVDGGLIPTTLHIVGHSYGAQIAGNIGRNVNFVVPKIVALDAAYPRFSETEVHSLRKTDAEFVLVIHTEAGIFGITYPAGHVDFFPNRGESPQPGCELTEGGATARITEIVCSHQRSCSFYGESLRNTDAFYGRACDSYEEFEAGLCSSNATVVMGYETPTTARGTFTLQTNSASPYGRGISGATYEA